MPRFASGGGSFYSIDEFPRCNQLAIFSNVYLAPELRGQGRGTMDHKARLRQAEELGFDAAICTVSADNEPQRRILLKNGWTCVYAFRNRVTGHMIEVWICTISRIETLTERG